MNPQARLLLFIIFGAIVSYGLHAASEIWWLNYADRHDLAITWTDHFGVGACALPWWVQYGLFLLGLIGGGWIGLRSHTKLDNLTKKVSADS